MFGGGASMGIREIAERVALCRARTAMANAFRRALGMRQLWDMPARGSVMSTEAYADMAECFANHGSPMNLVL